jgi:AraC-like DNA-binding protein
VLIVIELFYYFVISTLLGLFGLHLTLKKGFIASKILGISFLIYCFRIFTSYFLTDGRLLENPHFMKIQSSTHFLTGPIGYLFIFFLLFPKRIFSKWHWLLFLPFSLHLAELLPFYFGPVEAKIKEINLAMQYKSLIDYPSEVTFFSPKVLTQLKFISQVAFFSGSLFLVIQFVRKRPAGFYSQNSWMVNWLGAQFICGALSLYFTYAYTSGKIGFNNLQFSYADLLMVLNAFVNLGVVLIRPSILDGPHFQSLVFRLHKDQREAVPGEDQTKLKKYIKIANQVEHYFLLKKPFLNPDLTLDILAKELSVPARDLSRSVQYVYKLSYPDFVNSWRINYLLEQRKVNELWKTYSQDVLAEYSGFGSRQGLHNAINRLHGMTPATFFAQKEGI